MMHRKLLFLSAALLGAAALLAAPSQARADLIISLQEAGVNGGAITTFASTATDFSSVSKTGTYGDFTVTIFGGSSDNAATMSDILSSTTSVQNSNLLTSGEHTLVLYVTQTNYTLPTGPKLNVQSSLGGSINQGTLGLTGVFQAYADKNNNANGTGDFSNGPQNANQTGSSYDTGSANGLFTRGSGSYSLTSVITFDLSAGGKANFSSQENVTQAPAPAAVVLALVGMPFLGVGAWWRRRKAG